MNKINKKRNETVDAICELVAESIKRRSIKPMGWLFRKGSYGSRNVLKGNYVDYRKYQKRQERRIDFAVVD